MNHIKKYNEDITGHRQNDEWIDETPQAKLRNALGPFWMLSKLLNKDLERIIGTDYLKNLIKKCEESKDRILELIDETESKSPTK